jgi:hypothetical protein
LSCVKAKLKENLIFKLASEKRGIPREDSNLFVALMSKLVIEWNNLCIIELADYPNRKRSFWLYQVYVSTYCPAIWPLV